MEVRLPNGKIGKFDLVKHNDSVSILPLDNEGNIWFVSQYRLGAGKELLELPAGVMDKKESPIKCAAREVREETGLGSKKITQIGSVYLDPGYSNELNYIFLAEDLIEDPLEQDEDEFLSIHAYSRGEVRQFIRDGEIKDSKTIAALYILEQLEND